MSENFRLAPVNPDQRFVEQRVIRFSDALNATGLYSSLKSNGMLEQGQEALAGLVTSAVECRANQRFHESLWFFEKLGFLSAAKQQRHAVHVARCKGAANFTTRVLLDLIPRLVEKAQRDREFRKLSDFAIDWLAYVNQEPSIALQARIKQLYDGNLREFDNQRYAQRFERALSSRPGLLAPVPACLRGDPEQTFASLLGACDLSQPQTMERAQEFGDFLGLSATSIEQQLAVAGDTFELTSAFTGFAGFSIRSWFESLAENLQRARATAEYTVLNDPYRAIREQRKTVLLQGGSAVAGVALACAGQPEAAVLLTTSLPIIRRAVSADLTPERAAQLVRTILRVKKELAA